MKQTAVEWLFDEMLKGKFSLVETITKAKQKEREQIESAYKKGKVNGLYKFDKEPNITSSEYYEKTFKK